MTCPKIDKNKAVDAAKNKVACVKVITKVLKMSRSTYYRWLKNSDATKEKKYKIKITGSVLEKIKNYVLSNRFCRVQNVIAYLRQFGISIGKNMSKHKREKSRILNI